MTAIRNISKNAIPLSLMLHADPEEMSIERYLPGAKCFGAFVENSLVGVCVTNLNKAGVWEIFNLVVSPDKQKQGVGTKLLEYVIKCFTESGDKQLELGTGTFGYQLLFYQRFGFRVTSIWANFFIDNYSEPICEQGVQLKDMLRLSLKLSCQN